MATVTFISVGSLKEKYLTEAVAEYKKRLLQYARVEEIELKEERIANEDDRAEIARALDTEGEKILARMPRDAKKIALCVEGRQYSSEELATVLGEGLDFSGKLVFIIGSSHGLSDKVKSECDLKLSISRLTFPHQLVKPLLFEIVYRSFTIRSGKRYHK